MVTPNVSKRLYALNSARYDIGMKILFVCLGNICRSPTAEGVFLSLLLKRTGSVKLFDRLCWDFRAS